MGEVCAVEPVSCTLADVELVTIPAWHYADLLACQRAVAAGAAISPAHPAMRAIDPRSRLFGDPEVCVFLFEAFGRMKLKDVSAACRKRFGADRSPSRSTIARYWAHLR